MPSLPHPLNLTCYPHPLQPVKLLSLLLINLITERGVQPHFCPWKNVCFPIFPHGEKWGKKVYGKRGKSIHFPLFPYTFFPMGKMGKHTFFHGQKWGWIPSPQLLLIKLLFL